MALPQREMESRKGEIVELEREVDQLKVLFVCTCLLSVVLLKCGICTYMYDFSGRMNNSGIIE